MPIKNINEWDVGHGSINEINKETEENFKKWKRQLKAKKGLSVIGKANLDFPKFEEWFLNTNLINYTDLGLEEALSDDEIWRMINRSRCSDDAVNKGQPSYSDKRTLQKMKAICDYQESFDDAFELLFLNDRYAIISYGSLESTIVKKETLFNLVFLKKYENTPINEVDDEIPNALIPLSSSLAVKSMHEITTEKQQIHEELLRVDACESEELMPLKKEFDKRMAELEAYRDQIYQLQMAKERELLAKVAELNKEMFLLETQIYTIRCYLGEAVSMKKIRSGKAAAIEEPVVLYQKMRYLDEELGRLKGRDFDFTDEKLFEDLLKKHEDVLDLFCPSEKSINMIRISKSGQIVDEENGMLKNYELYHGKRPAILVRNGSNVWIGWCDEKKIRLADNMFISQGTNEKTSKEDVASRLFIFSVLNGLQQFSDILALPEKVDFAKGSKYIIYSSADTLIEDNTYLPFLDLIRKANQTTKEQDMVLVIRNISDGRYSVWGGFVYDRGTGNTSRTEDARVKNGIHKISFIDTRKTYPDFYISAKKERSETGATARMRVEEGEFINLNWLNSLLLSYYIDTKRVSTQKVDGAKMDYAYIVWYLLQAKEYLVKRENEEAERIKPYMDILRVNKWQNYVSSFKLIHHIRTITDYQAKRFAKWYKNLTMEEMDVYKDYLIINDFEKYMNKDSEMK